MDGLDLQFWLTLGVVAAIAVALVRDVARPDVVFLVGLGVLLLAGAVTPEDAFSGFSNPAVLAVGALFIVAAGLEETGALKAFDRVIFGSGSDLRTVLPRMLLPTAGLSAFVNNTPIVAILAPRVQRWAQNTGISPSKVLIPLSYAAIAGGMVTLIGTSTNIIVSGLLEEAGYAGFGLFDLTWIGLLAVTCVVTFFTFVGCRLLPEGEVRHEPHDDGLREFLFEARVGEKAPMAGKTPYEAGLHSLVDAELVHIRRGDDIVLVEKHVTLAQGDVLMFTGKTSVLEELLQRPGLEPVVPLSRTGAPRTRPLFDAVVSDTSSLVGRSLRETTFRERYQAVVLAIQRRDERIEGPLRRVPIKPGDLLLVEASEGFDERWNANRSEFYMVSARRAGKTKRLDRKAPRAFFILAVMIPVIGLRLLPLATAAFTAALAMIASGCLSVRMARRALNLEVLILLAAALGLGRAVGATGLTEMAADTLLHLSAGGIIAVLVGLYVITNVLTELVTHKAAAVLMLPVALALAVELGVEPKAFALTVAVAAAASFMTPVGYQTNLMVMAAGEYRVRDYLRVGLPVSVLVMLSTTVVIFFTWIS